MSRHYPSDISRQQFALIEPILESCRKKTKPRRMDLYEVFCGVCYVLKSGCQWDMLPKEYPKWRTCYYYFSLWNQKKENGLSILEECLKKIRWRGETKPWSQLENQLYHYRRAKREEYGQRGKQGV
jgi:transposase